MECIEHRAKIDDTFTSISTLSFNEKKTFLSEEEMTNKFLDAILDFKALLEEKIKKLDSINEKIEGLTWFTDLDEECLMKTNELISVAKDLYLSLRNRYVAMNNLRRKGIAKEEIKEYKRSIDELKESYSDLESALFFLPEIPEFKETTRLLSLV